MFKTNLKLIILTGATLSGIPARANELLSELKTRSLSESELVLRANDLKELGIKLSGLVSRNGSSMVFLPDEMVKVGFHD